MNAPTRLIETAAPHRFTWSDVLKMVEAGILDEKARVELIEGELIEVPPESLPHIRTRRWLTQYFIRRLEEGVWEVNPDAPAVLEPYSAPEPDIYIFPSRLHDRDVTGADIVLAIEVSVSSLDWDLRRKGPIYARHGVQEYWVVDVEGRRLLIHRNPSADGYLEVTEVGIGGAASPLAFPVLSVKVGDLPFDD